MQVLIVDDDEITLELLDHALTQLGHDVQRAADGQAMELAASGKFPMIITDWEMPGVDGLELCRRIRDSDEGGYIYIIMLTSRTSSQDRVEGLNAGADDFISKPVDPAELQARVRTGQRILALETYDTVIFGLAKLAESRDPETGAHLERVQNYSRTLARDLARLPKYSSVMNSEFVRLIYLTSPLHDIGKVSIPDVILLKPARLPEAEFKVMELHTKFGAETLSASLAEFPDAKFLEMARDIAMCHHEKFDGSGYPNGLSGEDIPLAARIVTVADVYDALVSKRVYKPSMTHEQAKNLILRDAGNHFDPDMVDAFIRCEDKFLDIKARFGE